VSFTSAFPTNLPKLSIPGVRVPRYTYVCNILLKYVEVGDVVDPTNHRRIYDSLICTANNVASWVSKVSEFFGGLP
jgi:hypothetical protein